MEMIIEAEWRWLPCLVLLAGAGWFFVRATGDWRSLGKAPHRNLRHMVAFRKAMLGIGMTGVALGWWLGSPVAFWFGLVVATEETIETSIALVGLRMEGEA